MKTMSGSCLCGEVKFKTSGAPFAVEYCHCQSCRKHTSAPVVVLAGFKKNQVEFYGKERKRYESSEGVYRGFCETCGTPLTWEGVFGNYGDVIEIHISAFDEPEKLNPVAHAFEPERLPWLNLLDELPRHEGFTIDSPILNYGLKNKIKD